MKLLLSLLMLLTIANAQDKLETAKTSCIQQSLYPNKTLDEQKKILIEKAKQESLEELYGTLISSSTDIENGKMISDKIKSRAVGAVRVNGNPSFYNGKNLGEICTDVKVYITKKDLAKYSPKKVSLTHYCFNDPSVAMKDIKTEAKYGAYKEIISQYKPSMKVTGKQAEQFIHGFTISNDKFDFDTASYCFNAVGTILPYELEMGGVSKVDNVSNGNSKVSKGNSIMNVRYLHKDKLLSTKKLLLPKKGLDLIGVPFPYLGNISSSGTYTVFLDSMIKIKENGLYKFKVTEDVSDIKVYIDKKLVVSKNKKINRIELLKGNHQLEIKLKSSRNYDFSLAYALEDDYLSVIKSSDIFIKNFSMKSNSINGKRKGVLKVILFNKNMSNSFENETPIGNDKIYLEANGLNLHNVGFPEKKYYSALLITNLKIEKEGKYCFKGTYNIAYASIQLDNLIISSGKDKKSSPESCVNLTRGNYRLKITEMSSNSYDFGLKYNYNNSDFNYISKNLLYN